MNTSVIADMLRSDPSLRDDVSGLVKRLNTKDRTRTISRYVEIVHEKVSEPYSLADEHGGECTEAEVQSAIASIDNEGMLVATERLSDALKSAIMTGDKEAILKSLDDVIAASNATKEVVRGD